MTDKDITLEQSAVEYFDLMRKLARLEIRIIKEFGAPSFFELQLDWQENKQYEPLKERKTK